MKPPALVFLALFLAAPLFAEGKRIAFVVGVDTYTKLAPEAQLKVAVSDAERMSDTLGSLDPPFEVTLLKDTDWKSAQESFDTFLNQAKAAECALVYFAGHGIEYHGENFLLVKDTDIADISADVERMKRRLSTAAVSLQDWVDSLDSTRAQVKLVILDCCRDNPLKADDGSGARSVVGGSRGLAQVTPPSGTLISYSADAGQQANDGLFTEVLTNNLKAPGLNIVKVFAKTREEVREISETWAAEDAAKGLAPGFRRPRHEPAEYNKLNLAGTDFAFTRGVPVAVKVEDGSGAEMAKLRAELDAEKKARAEAEAKAKKLAEGRKGKKGEAPAAVMPVPSTPDPRPSTPSAPMVKTDPVPAPAFPASRGMEGSRAGEVREFGGIEMIWCPPGEFLMGSPEDEADRQEDETRHRVTLTKGFWLAKTECTQAQWESVMGTDAAALKASAEKDQTYGKVNATGPDVAMYFTSWDDAQKWLAEMNEKHPLSAGWKWDLPTEAQWEYACRAGTETACAGVLDEMAWYDENSGSKTNPVGTKKANAWGLHDMHGNVWEWCADRYGDYLSGAVTDPTGSTYYPYRVLRGSSWLDRAARCRSAIRNRIAREFRRNDLGFRPAAVPTSR